MLQRVGSAIAALSVVIVLGTAPPAVAFDGGPHEEITANAMTMEGFGTDAIGVAQVNNWFVDFYEQAESNSFSGHSDWLKRALTGAVVTENWSDEVIAAAYRSHFDTTPDGPFKGQVPSLSTTVGIKGEWDRLRRTVWTLVQEARDENDPEKLLTVLGMSLHQVQDYYTHTNWVEPLPGRGVPGSDGPGWEERGFGSYPTWFDIPASAREAANIYGDGTHGHRAHGHWNTEGNQSFATAMNKDWPGRPHYDKAIITAAYASYQWIGAVRSWVGDDAFWARVQRYQANQKQLDHDLRGMFEMALYAGHWQGQGEPIKAPAPGASGSLFSLRQAARRYFQPWYTVLGGLVLGGPLRAKTEYRARFERLIVRMADPHPTGDLAPVPSSQDLQHSTRIVKLKVLSMRGGGFGGLGDPGPDDADMYADVKIDGQLMHSAVIHGHDSFSFPDPYEPFTWFKIVPAVPDDTDPVESIELEVKTADARWAGTDDDVFLRLSPNLRFPLDKRLYNDFERNDRDTYSVPIDAEVWRGMRVGDIGQVQIEKSRDFLAGGWKLGGVKLRVNGKVVYDNQGINRWLEDDSRTWRAPDFVPRNPRGGKIPVVIRIGEDDLLYGGNDKGDVNPFDKRRDVSIGYVPGRPREAATRGGSLLGGRLFGDGDEASIAYRLETIAPKPMRPPSGSGDPLPLPPVSERPELLITEFFFDTVTVENQGAGPAGPFRLSIRGISHDEGQITETFKSLAPGESQTRAIAGLSCRGRYIATVDDLEQVDEVDENNNFRDSSGVLC